MAAEIVEDKGSVKETECPRLGHGGGGGYRLVITEREGEEKGWAEVRIVSTNGTVMVRYGM